MKKVRDSLGNLNSGSERDLRPVLDAIVDELNVLRTSITTLTAKIDTDATAQNAAVTASQLDVNYASTCDPAAITVEK